MAKIMNMEDYRGEVSEVIERLKKDLESEKRKNYMLQSENDMLHEQNQTFNMPNREVQELNRMAKEMDVPKHIVMRSAFRIYQSLHVLMKEQGLSDMRDVVWPRLPSKLNPRFTGED